MPSSPFFVVIAPSFPFILHRFLPPLLNTFSKMTCATMPEQFLSSGEKDLFLLPINFQMECGSEVQLRAVYQDTHPTISCSFHHKSPTTVVFVHGSPGSHKDFKYMVPLLRERGLRSIAFNWPGMGYTSYDNRLRLTNPERTSFARALLDRLLPPTAQLIIVGHSRGGENAIRLACEYPERAKALFLINSCGFRAHKAARPQWSVRMAARIWNFDERLQRFLAPIFQKIHDRVGLKTENGYIAGRSVITHSTYDFEKLRPMLDILLKGHPSISVVFAYSGKDTLIEKEISEELANVIGGPTLISLTTPREEDAQLLEKFTEQVREGKQRRLSLYFANEGHFLQKHQASFMAKCVTAIEDCDLIEAQVDQN